MKMEASTCFGKVRSTWAGSTSVRTWISYLHRLPVARYTQKLLSEESVTRQTSVYSHQFLLPQPTPATQQFHKSYRGRHQIYKTLPQLRSSICTCRTFPALRFHNSPKQVHPSGSCLRMPLKPLTREEKHGRKSEGCRKNGWGVCKKTPSRRCPKCSF